MSFFITTLFLSLTRLPVSYNNGYDDLLVVLDIKPGVYGLGGCGSGVYGLFIWLIAVSLLS